MKVLFFLLISLSALGNCIEGDSNFNCVKYLKNYDGDTVTFKIDEVHPLLGEKISIRVAGVDTPEKRTKDRCEKEKARTAQRLVENQLKRAKSIKLKGCERGKYFRLVCSVEYDGKDLKEILIKNKLAVSYDGGTKEKVDWCLSEKD